MEGEVDVWLGSRLSRMHQAQVQSKSPAALPGALTAPILGKYKPMLCGNWLFGDALRSLVSYCAQGLECRAGD